MLTGAVSAQAPHLLRKSDVISNPDLQEEQAGSNRAQVLDAVTGALMVDLLPCPAGGRANRHICVNTMRV